MRVGLNPNKDKTLSNSNYTHQVVIPIYIPHQNDYFKDSFQILKLCLESLFKTSHSKTYFTVVNNGSCHEVVAYLSKLYQEDKLQEVIHTTAIGKLNAVLKGITGHQFPLITVSDADVLFLNQWQRETYKVFDMFPKAGAVCTTPSPKSFNNNTFNIITENFFSKKLFFTRVNNSEALEKFAASIGNDSFYKPIHLKKNLTISNGSFSAVIGAGHFVTTYRSDIFDAIGMTSTSFSLGGSSESILLDLPVIKKGYWRVSTAENYTFHLGNVKEPWMFEALDKLKKEKSIDDFNLHHPLKKPSQLIFWINNTLLEKLFYIKKIKFFFLKLKGLTMDEAKEY